MTLPAYKNHFIVDWQSGIWRFNNSSTDISSLKGFPEYSELAFENGVAKLIRYLHSNDFISQRIFPGFTNGFTLKGFTRLIQDSA
jgi:hypothetical protein